MYLRNGPTQITMCCHTEMLQIRLATSPSHSKLTLCQPVLVLTLSHQVPGCIATRVLIFMTQSEKAWFNPCVSCTSQLRQLTERGFLENVQVTGPGKMKYKMVEFLKKCTKEDPQGKATYRQLLCFQEQEEPTDFYPYIMHS